ncbi:MAG: sensor histidine kinase [Tenacibaculum sp.]
MVFYSITVFALTHFLFAKHNTEYNYLALPVCALLFFDKKWMHYLWLMISILLFFTPYYFIKIRNIDGFVPEEKVFLFVILFLVVKFFRDLSELNERKLEDAYIRLEKTKEYELAYSQLKSLRSQMNPHFIFNALNSIQEYIMLNEKELASVYLIDFSSLMRMYLEHSQRQYISLQEELVSLNLYLRLEKIRFEEEFNYEINVDNKIDKEKIIIPSVFIQPYIENAIKHGLFHKRDNRKLKIQFLLNLDTKVLRCIIHDNGIGRKAAGELKKKNTNYHKSYATKANQKRIDLINLNKERKIKIYVEDLYEKTNSIGTKVCIEIPQ